MCLQDLKFKNQIQNRHGETKKRNLTRIVSQKTRVQVAIFMH
jgi:translation initiation factor IF-3